MLKIIKYYDKDLNRYMPCPDLILKCYKCSSIKGDNENKNKNEVGNIKNENQNSVEVFTHKRMIHNKNV